jgi:hypothetical protein
MNFLPTSEGDLFDPRSLEYVGSATIFVFLASSEARFVTGEVYRATGGGTPY